MVMQAGSLVDSLADSLPDSLVKQTLELVKESVEKKQGGPFGAVVFNTLSHEAVAFGTNHVLAENDPTAHAEVCAIRKACVILKTPHLVGYSIYSTGQPCPMCLAAICWARLDACYYSTTYEDAKAIGFDDAAIRDFLLKKSVSQPFPLKVAEWPNREVKQFFLGYKGSLY